MYDDVRGCKYFSNMGTGYTSVFSGFNYRKAKGTMFFHIFSLIIAAMLAYVACIIADKKIPGLIYMKENLPNGRVEYEFYPLGGLIMAGICGIVAAYVYNLFFSHIAGGPGQELAGGSFFIDQKKIDYSITGIRTSDISLLVDGKKAEIRQADKADRNFFLPRLLSHRENMYKQYRKTYFVAVIDGNVIRISPDGKAICINDEPVVYDTKMI